MKVRFRGNVYTHCDGAVANDICVHCPGVIDPVVFFETESLS